MRTGKLSVLLAITIFLAAFHCHATEVRYDFSGAIMELLLLNPAASPPDEMALFSIHSAFSGYIVYDTSAIEGPFRSLNPNRHQANYPEGLIQMYFQSGSYSYSLPDPASINVTDGLIGGDIDIFSVNGGGPSESVYSISLSLAGSGSIIIGYSIPLAIYTSAFPYKDVVLHFSPTTPDGSIGLISGQIDKWEPAVAVPAPNSSILFLAGLAMLFGLRSNRQVGERRLAHSDG